jgi:hypothetical protein
MRLYLIIDKPGLTLKIPGVAHVRTPVKMDISKLNLNTVISELKKEGIQSFTIEYGDKTKKVYSVNDESEIKKEKTSTAITQVVDERVVQRIMEDFKRYIGTDKNIEGRLDKIESLIQALLEKDFGKETVVVKNPSFEKIVKKDEDYEEVDFIPSIKIDKMVSKGTTKSSTILSTNSNDLNETLKALNEVTKK